MSQISLFSHSLNRQHWTLLQKENMKLSSPFSLRRWQNDLLKYLMSHILYSGYQRAGGGMRKKNEKSFKEYKLIHKFEAKFSPQSSLLSLLSSLQFPKHLSSSLLLMHPCTKYPSSDHIPPLRSITARGCLCDRQVLMWRPPPCKEED